MSNAEAQAQEPSMEEILASIRRIISEDSEAAPANEASKRSPGAGDNVLELTEMVGEDGEVVSLRDEPTPSAREDEPAAAAQEDAPAEQQEDETVAEPASAEVAFAAADAADDSLMSDDKASAAAAAMTSLLGAVAKPTAEAPPPSDGRTVEAIARELMRPVLKEWLDKNLPDMVERIVRSEIQRVVGRAGGQ